jgi:DNA-binding NarL/FixJ family response regulator
MVKLRGLSAVVEETPGLVVAATASNQDEALLRLQNAPEIRLALLDLRLGSGVNGIGLGRVLLTQRPDLRVVIYTQEPSWALASEVFRAEYQVGSRSNGRATGKGGLHGYILLSNIYPATLTELVNTVVRQNRTYIDREVMQRVLERTRNERLTPRQAECAGLVADGYGNEIIAERMGFFKPDGTTNPKPVERLVSDLYKIFSIEGEGTDPGRRVMLAHAYEAYMGLREN